MVNYRSIVIGIIQTTAMFVAGFIIPVAGQIIALFTPVPLVLAYLRGGRTEGLIVLIASGLFLTILGGWHTAAILVLTFGLMAIGLSEGMRRQWKPDSAVVLGGMLPMIVLSAIAAYLFSRIGKNPVIVVEEYLKGSMTEAARLYAEIGLREMSSAIASVPDTFIHNLVRLLPGITIATSVFQAASCYGLSRIILARRPGNAPVAPAIPLAKWHAPDVWVCRLTVRLPLVVIPSEAARFAGWNLAIIYSVVYLTQGVAIVEFYLRKVRIQPFIRGMIHALILLLPSVVFVVALGIIDIWADLRKVRGPGEQV